MSTVLTPDTSDPDARIPAHLRDCLAVRRAASAKSRNVHDGMQGMQREIFGPLLPIAATAGMKGVVRHISDRPNPLAPCLFSDERHLREQVMGQTLSGGVTTNDTLLHPGQHSLPFAGVGASGMGHYRGLEGLLTFSKLRPVFQQGPRRTASFLQPPY